MKNIYVYRNMAVEYLFQIDNMNFEFSSYGDINIPDKEYDAYLFFYILPYKFNKDILISEIENYYERIKYVLKKNPNKEYYVLTLYSYFDANFIYSDYKLQQKINNYNEKLYELGNSVKVIDIEHFFEQFDSNYIMDMKFYYLYNTIINPKLKEKFAEFIKQEIEKYEGHRKKCLVLDLDNTLWQGIIGEDGINNVKISGDYPGNSYADFQSLLLEMKKNGIILCIASKNNQSDVELLFETRKDMILKKDDFVIIKANWDTKDKSIIQISKELNISLSDIVFIDDNPVERETVKMVLPDVVVPNFPKEPYLLTKFYAEEFRKLFSIEKLTDEDVVKTNQYKAKLQADNYKNSFSSIDEFIQSLEMQIDYEEINENNAIRILELINKSNQFNLTTKRYTMAEIEKMRNTHLIYALKVKDKFDDLGIVGVSIIKLDSEIPKIDTFLLSCRVIGRNLEYSFLDYMLDILKQKGCKKVKAKYIKTEKNGLVKDFYLNAKYDIIKKDENEIIFKKII